MPDAPPPPRGPSGRVAVLLVVSGAAALLHETAWFRLLVPVLGAGAIPGAAVAAAALVGIAIGSAIGGRLADRVARPAFVLFLGEALAAAAGLAIPRTVAHLDQASVPLLCLAAIPWGITIPAALRTAAPPGDRVARTFGRLYAWNTLGAVLGIALGAAYLFEALGNLATIRFASGLQLAIAVAALALAFARPPPVRDPVAAEPSPPPPPAIQDHRPVRPRLALAAALAGAAGVGTQIAWTRRLTPILGATFPAFAAVLAVHLAGIALGTAFLGPRRGTRPRLAVALLAVVAALATAGTPFALGEVVEAVRERWWASTGHALEMLGWRAAISASLVLPGVLAGAALLPWLVRASDPDGDHAGRTSGRLVAANTFGSALGGLVVALALVPAVGTAGALALCGAALALAGAVVLEGRGRAALFGLSLAGAALGVVRPFGDEAGSSSVGALYSVTAYRPADVLTLLARDGTSASVLVRDRDGRLEFWVEGSFEASTCPTDRLHLGLLGHLPLALFEARTDRPPRVALVGLGGGLTAQAVSRHATASFHVYELEPAVAFAAERFREAGGGLPKGATLHIEDGRRAIVDDPSTELDVISSDPIHPSVAGSAYLYSLEYWKASIGRISPEGFLVSWLPLYQMHVEELKLALRTFCEAVPYPYVFLAGGDAILVGTRTPLALDAARLARALESDAGADLRAFGFGRPGRLLGLLALDPDGCREVAGEGPINTDDRLLLELRCGWREADDPGTAYELFTSIPADPRTLLTGTPDPTFEKDLGRAARFEAAMAAWVRWDLPEATNRFTELAAAEPANDLVRRMRDEATAELSKAYLAAGNPARAAALARDLAARENVDAILRLDAADVLLRTGDAVAARAIAAPYAANHAWPRAKRLVEGR